MSIIDAAPAQLEAFLVFPSGRVEMIDRDGDTSREWRDPNLYDTLVLAGYPVADCALGMEYGFIDICVDPDNLTEVMAHTENPGRQVPMGASSQLFLGWYAEEVL